jgi:hypothetical protein
MLKAVLGLLTSVITLSSGIWLTEAWRVHSAPIEVLVATTVAGGSRQRSRDVHQGSPSAERADVDDVGGFLF